MTVSTANAAQKPSIRSWVSIPKRSSSRPPCANAEISATAATNDGRTSGSAAATAKTRRAGRSVRVTSQAIDGPEEHARDGDRRRQPQRPQQRLQHVLVGQHVERAHRASRRCGRRGRRTAPRTAAATTAPTIVSRTGGRCTAPSLPRGDDDVRRVGERGHLPELEAGLLDQVPGRLHLVAQRAQLELGRLDRVERGQVLDHGLRRPRRAGTRRSPRRSTPGLPSSGGTRRASPRPPGSSCSSAPRPSSRGSARRCHRRGRRSCGSSGSGPRPAPARCSSG